MTQPSEPTAYTLRTGRRWRAARLRELGYASYDEYLLSDHWRILRRIYFLADDTPKACFCGEDDPGRLHIHHKTYLRVGSEHLDDLRALCGHCHRDVHLAIERCLAPYDLADYESEERRMEYAETRRRELQRRGEEPERHDDRPYEEYRSRVNAAQRHAGAQDRRKAARQLARNIRAMG